MEFNRRSILRYSGALAGIPLAGCGVLTPSYSFRLLHKLYVSIDRKEYVASTVMDVRWTYFPKMFLDAGDGWMERNEGQAITIGLGEASVLVGTLGGFWDQKNKFNPNKFGLFDLLPNHSVNDEMDIDRCFSKLQSLEGEHDLKTWAWPVMFYFADRDDWQTVALVNGNTSAIGSAPSIAVKRFTVTVTSDAVSSGIEKELPLIAQIRAFKPDPRSIPSQRPLYQQLKVSQFEVDGTDRMGAT